MKSPIHIPVLALLVAVSLYPALSQAQERKTESSDISQRVNPAKAKPRFFLRNEFRQREDGTHINILEPLYDHPLTDKVVLRTQVPLVTNNPTDNSSKTGLGDITSRLSYQYKREGGSSYFVGLEARWDTASDRRLGVGKTLLSPVWFANINVPEYKSILFPLVQTFFTVAGDDNRPDINYTVLKPRFLTKLENRYYLFGEPLIYIDHEDDNDTTGVFELEFGRFVNSQTMLYLRPGGGLWGNTGSPYLYDWNFEVGYRYFF